MQKKTIIYFGILVLLGSLIFVNGCKPSTSQQNKEITICQWGQALIYLPLYIAQEKGFFEEQGLKVKVINGGGDDLTWAAVTSGNAQFGIADPTMIAIQAEQGGVPGKIIGDIVGKIAFWAITFDQNVKEISKPEDFRNNTIACFKFPNTAHALALKTFQKGKLTPGKDVNIVPVNYEAVLAQLQNKEANIAMVLEPAASSAVDVGARIVYSYPKEWGNFAFTGLTCTEEYIKNNPETVQKVTNALEKALFYARTDLKGTIEVGKKAFPDLSQKVIEMAVNRMLIDKTMPEHLMVNDDGWNKALQVCIDVKKLRALPHGSLVDNSFAQKAIKVMQK